MFWLKRPFLGHLPAGHVWVVNHNFCFVVVVVVATQWLGGAVGGADHGNLGTFWTEVQLAPFMICSFHLVGGFKHFVIFHNIWDNPSHWLSYISRWFKPPTSHFLLAVTNNFTNRSPTRRIRWSASAPSTQPIRPSFASLGLARGRPGRPPSQDWPVPCWDKIFTVQFTSYFYGYGDGVMTFHRCFFHLKLTYKW